MDIYEFINSRDIREYLKAKQYTFDPLQQAFLVWQSGRHTLTQKHEPGTAFYIEYGSHWKNGYVESFNSKMRDDFLNITIFDTMKEAIALSKILMHEYNYIRPHSSLGNVPPAIQAVAV